MADVDMIAFPSNEGLTIKKDGCHWTEQDLCRFGIKYHLKISEPKEIFENIHPYLHGTQTSLSRLGVQKLADHITMLQENFKDAFVLDVDSFELLDMINTCFKKKCRLMSNSAEKESKWKEIHKNIRLNIAGAKLQLQVAKSNAVSQSWDPTFVMIESFLTKLNSVLMRASSPSNFEVNTSTFVDLFQHFARIFLVEFIPSTVKQTTLIGGVKVTSANDLRYDYEDHEQYEECDSEVRIVVTVPEVKDDAMKKNRCYQGRKPRSSKVLKTEGRADVGGARADTDEEEDHEDEDKVEFHKEQRGQLGIDLLANLPRSCLQEVNNKRMILGLTVEVTWVRLACLQVDDMAAFRDLQKKAPPKNVPHIGTIFYTRAYDMLKKSDRHELIYIMRYLLFLSNDTAVVHLPKGLLGWTF